MNAKISVVVQGKIYNDITPLSLNSIRKYLPKAEIILSTWKGADLSNLDYDHLILNDMPEVFVYSNKNGSKINNINLQILSTLSGIKVSTGEYILKLRTDFLLTGNTFLKFFHKFNFIDNYMIFKHRVIACCYFTRDPRQSNLAFHPSDIAFFGLKQDLLNLFEIPLMPKSEEFYIKNNKGEYLNRYLPEQYIFTHFLEKNGKDPLMMDQLHINKRFIEQTEHYFASNFILLNWKLFNLLPPVKFKNFYENNYFSCITHVEWKQLYYKYNLDHHLSPLSNFLLLLQDLDRLTLKFKFFYLKFLKIFAKLITIPLIGNNKKNLRRALRKKIIRFCSF